MCRIARREPFVALILFLATCSSSPLSGIAVLGLLGGTVSSEDGIAELSNEVMEAEV